MSNIHLLELPLSRAYFHGSKGVRAIEALLYISIGKNTAFHCY